MGLIIQKIIQFLPIIFEKIFGLVSKNDRFSKEENWYNPDDKYNERSLLENSEEDKIEDNIGAANFYGPVEMDIPFVTSKWGWRILRGKKVWHSGTDFRALDKSACNAVEDSLIVETVGLKNSAPCRFVWKNGKWIDLHNGSITPRIALRGKYTGNLYIYKHAVLNSQLKVGIAVIAGQNIGHYGNYGYSMGSHCHFEYWTPKNKTVKFSKNYRKGFKQQDPVEMMSKEFGLSFTGRV